MPSRRDALAALGSATTLSLSGCLGVTHAPSAYCQLKSVMVTWTHDAQQYRDDVGRSVGHPPDDDSGGEVRTRVAEELLDIASGPREFAVDEAMETRLTREFASVEYILGFCGDAFDTCRNTRAASRAAFNAVQVGDEARVTLSDNAFRVHSVDPPDEEAVSAWETAYNQFDFSVLHADHGEPLADES
jgi:hypothetical protein